MNGHELGKRKCAMFINTHLYFIYYYSMQHFSMNVCSKGNIFCLRFPCYISEIVQLLMLYTAFYYISPFRVPKVSWRTFVNFYDCGCGLSTIFRNIGFRTMVLKVTAVIVTTAFLPITENYSTVINLLVQFTWWFRLMHQSYLLQLGKFSSFSTPLHFRLIFAQQNFLHFYHSIHKYVIIDTHFII